MPQNVKNVDIVMSELPTILVGINKGQTDCL